MSLCVFVSEYIIYFLSKSILMLIFSAVISLLAFLCFFLCADQICELRDTQVKQCKFTKYKLGLHAFFFSE